jgi:5-oxoprolinase (ATP-hydrolysing) subunit A
MKLINCDLGECLTPDPDEAIMPLVDMANIACGGHAGDVASMKKTIKLAKQHNVKVGAHPSYLDKENFGRISHDVSIDALFEILLRQITEFQKLCQQHDMEMHYIKPHGALYHDMMHKPEVLAVLCQLIHAVNPALDLVVQAGILQQGMAAKSKQTSINFIYEAFADRTYQGNQIIPRSESGAMLKDAEQIVAQYQRLSQQHTFTIDTICFHSDNPASAFALKLIKGF